MSLPPRGFSEENISPPLNCFLRKWLFAQRNIFTYLRKLQRLENNPSDEALISARHSIQSLSPTLHPAGQWPKGGHQKAELVPGALHRLAPHILFSFYGPRWGLGFWAGWACCLVFPAQDRWLRSLGPGSHLSLGQFILTGISQLFQGFSESSTNYWGHLATWRILLLAISSSPTGLQVDILWRDFCSSRKVALGLIL